MQLHNPFEVSKAGYGGAGYPDRLSGPDRPSIGQTRQVAANAEAVSATRGHGRDLVQIKRQARRGNQDALFSQGSRTKQDMGGSEHHGSRSKGGALGATSVRRQGRRTQADFTRATAIGTRRADGRNNLGRWTRKVRKNAPDLAGTIARPMIGRGVIVSVKGMGPQGSHVSHDNKLEHFTGLSGNYSQMGRGKDATKLGHYKKGRDKAAREFVGKAARDEPTAGRQILGGVVPGWHGMFAGKKGHKVEATARQGGRAAAQGLAVRVPLALGALHQARKGKWGSAQALATGSNSGGFAASVHGGMASTKNLHREGKLKAQKVGKSDLGGTASWSQPRKRSGVNMARPPVIQLGSRGL